MKKPKVKIKRVMLALLIIVVIVSSLYYVISSLSVKKKTDKVAVVINEIKAYGYTLEDNETKLYSKLFKELKSTLDASKVDEEKYAGLVAQLFASDFYNLDNKLNNGNVGGTQFIHTAARDNFVLKSQDTIYKYVENNMDGKRTQVLPEVTAVDISGTYDKSFKYNGATDANAYEVKITITYKEDLGYPKEVTLVLMHETETKLAIVEIN